MTNNSNDNTVEEVVLENKIANNVYNDESVVVIETGKMVQTQVSVVRIKTMK